MDTRINDKQRTILSAYHDGELSTDEIAEVERLLERSEEARRYLGDLRSLNHFSIDAFPVIPIGDAAIGAVSAAKLSSSAIQSAARASLAAKSGSAGIWGIAGLATAAVATAVAIVAFPSADEPKPLRADRQPVAAAPAAAPINLDSDALVVPAMSTQELVDFAVNGHVPIGTERDRYLTLAVGKEGSLAVQVAARPATSAMPAIQGISLAGLAGLDSIERILRMSLLKAPARGLAVRADLPSLRMHALEHLQGVAAQLPEHVRRDLTVAREEFSRTLRVTNAGRAPEDDRRVISPRGTRGPVRYYVISMGGSDSPASGGRSTPPVEIGRSWNRETFEVSNESLVQLESAMVNASAGEAGAVAAAQGVDAATAAVAPGARATAVARSSGRRTAPVVGTGPRRHTVPPFPPQAPLGFSVEFSQQADADSIIRMADEMIERTEKMIRRADSVQRVLQQRYRYGYSNDPPSYELEIEIPVTDSSSDSDDDGNADAGSPLKP